MSATVIFIGSFTNRFIYFEIRVCFFCLFIVMSCLKFAIGNGLLRFLGKYVFEIYILQRLPMIFLQGRIEDHLLYFTVCLFLTVFIAIYYKLITSKIDMLIINNINN